MWCVHIGQDAWSIVVIVVGSLLTLYALVCSVMGVWVVCPCSFVQLSVSVLSVGVGSAFGGSSCMSVGVSKSSSRCSRFLPFGAICVVHGRFFELNSVVWVPCFIIVFFGLSCWKACDFSGRLLVLLLALFLVSVSCTGSSP